MTSFIENAIAGALAVHRLVGGVAFTYRRSSTELEMVGGVFGKSDYTREAMGNDRPSGSLDVRSIDCSFGLSDNPNFVSTFSEPAAGDEIDVTRDGTTATYRVLPFGPDRREWRYADAGESQLRVHLRRTGVA